MLKKKFNCLLPFHQKLMINDNCTDISTNFCYPKVKRYGCEQFNLKWLCKKSCNNC